MSQFQFFFDPRGDGNSENNNQRAAAYYNSNNYGRSAPLLASTASANPNHHNSKSTVHGEKSLSVDMELHHFVCSDAAAENVMHYNNGIGVPPRAKFQCLLHSGTAVPFSPSRVARPLRCRLEGVTPFVEFSRMGEEMGLSFYHKQFHMMVEREEKIFFALQPSAFDYGGGVRHVAPGQDPAGGVPTPSSGSYSTPALHRIGGSGALSSSSSSPQPESAIRATPGAVPDVAHGVLDPVQFLDKPRKHYSVKLRDAKDERVGLLFFSLQVERYRDGSGSRSRPRDSAERETHHHDRHSQRHSSSSRARSPQTSKKTRDDDEERNRERNGSAARHSGSHPPVSSSAARREPTSSRHRERTEDPVAGRSPTNQRDDTNQHRRRGRENGERHDSSSRHSSPPNTSTLGEQRNKSQQRRRDPPSSPQRSARGAATAGNANQSDKDGTPSRKQQLQHRSRHRRGGSPQIRFGMVLERLYVPKTSMVSPHAPPPLSLGEPYQLQLRYQSKICETPPCPCVHPREVDFGDFTTEFDMPPSTSLPQRVSSAFSLRFALWRGRTQVAGFAIVPTKFRVALGESKCYTVPFHYHPNGLLAALDVRVFLYDRRPPPPPSSLSSSLLSTSSIHAPPAQTASGKTFANRDRAEQSPFTPRRPQQQQQQQQQPMYRPRSPSPLRIGDGGRSPPTHYDPHQHQQLVPRSSDYYSPSSPPPPPTGMGNTNPKHPKSHWGSPPFEQYPPPPTCTYRETVYEHPVTTPEEEALAAVAWGKDFRPGDQAMDRNAGGSPRGRPFNNPAYDRDRDRDERKSRRDDPTPGERGIRGRRTLQEELPPSNSHYPQVTAPVVEVRQGSPPRVITASTGRSAPSTAGAGAGPSRNAAPSTSFPGSSKAHPRATTTTTNISPLQPYSPNRFPETRMTSQQHHQPPPPATAAAYPPMGQTTTAPELASRSVAGFSYRSDSGPRLNPEPPTPPSIATGAAPWSDDTGAVLTPHRQRRREPLVEGGASAAPNSWWRPASSSSAPAPASFGRAGDATAPQQGTVTSAAPASTAAHISEPCAPPPPPPSSLSQRQAVEPLSPSASVSASAARGATPMRQRYEPLGPSSTVDSGPLKRTNDWVIPGGGSSASFGSGMLTPAATSASTPLAVRQQNVTHPFRDDNRNSQHHHAPMVSTGPPVTRVHYPPAQPSSLSSSPANANNNNNNNNNTRQQY